MEIKITERFLEDLTDLPESVSKKCRDLIKELRRTVGSEIVKGSLPGWRLHKLQSSPFRSISVDMQYRMLVKIERDTVFAHRVVKHALADSPHVNRNDSAIPLCGVDPAVLKFGEVADALAELGMPEPFGRGLKAVETEDQMLDGLAMIPAEWAKTALDLYELADIVIPKARYTSISADADFETALAKGSSYWQWYLHPSQSHIVELPWDLRVSVCGSAGTGKTVCAWHRMKALAAGNRTVAFICPNEDTLAISKQQLAKMMDGISSKAYFFVPKSPEEMKQVADRVDHLIFDEGQELPPTWYEAISPIIRRKKSGLTLFFDLNQLFGNMGAGHTSGYEKRSERWDRAIVGLGCLSLSLNINYRNSREISAYYFKLLKGALLTPITAEAPVFSAGDVIQRSVKSAADVPSSAFQLYRQMRRNLNDDEIAVVCLSKIGARTTAEIRAFFERAGVTVLNEPSGSHGLLITTPERIRGYERRAVLVIGPRLDAVADKVGRAIRGYTAMSRARDTLVVIEVEETQ